MRVIVSIFVFTSAVYAHGLGVDAVAGPVPGTVLVSAYYDDGTPAAGANVTLTLAHVEHIPMYGVTNADGAWVSPVLSGGTILIRVKTQDGHAAKKNVMMGKFDTLHSYGPSQEEFTATPWLAIGVGLGLIGTIGGVTWYRTRATSSG